MLGSVVVNCLLQECTSPAVCAAASVARSSSGGSISDDYCAAPLALSLLDACCREVQRVFAAAALVRWRDAAVLLPLCHGDPAPCVPLGEAASSVRSLSSGSRGMIRESAQSTQIFGWSWCVVPWSASIFQRVQGLAVIPDTGHWTQQACQLVQPVRVAVGSAAQAARVVWRF